MTVEIMNPAETIIREGGYIISLRDPMTEDCCSSYCVNWDKCYALGILDYYKVLPLNPEEVDKDWCRGLNLQPPQGIEVESLNM